MFVVVWAVGGLGRSGGCVRGRQLAVALASRLCGGGGGGWLSCEWCRRHARLGGLLRLLWSWWFGWLVGAPACCVGVACCRGSGVVRPGCLARPGAPRFFVGVSGGCGWVGCELYSGREHLTVSLRQCLFCRVLLFVFFERSVDALASGADEGRGGLRYSSGSRLAGCDPRVSEWGDPARVMSCHLHLNCIGCGG